MRLEDAHRKAMCAAAMLSEYFEAQATQHNDDTTKMFAAMGFEHLANDVIEQLEIMMAAARDLRGGAR